jgi:non-specific serine/threonine protein kinase
VALWRFWHLHGHWQEGRAWLEGFLALTLPDEGASGVKLRAHALRGAGSLAWCQGEYESATELLEESLGLCRGLNDERGMAYVLNTLGIIADGQGDCARAVALYEESLALWRTLHDVGYIGALLHNVALIAYRQERYAEAIDL